MKKLLLFCAFALLASFAQAQDLKKITLKGLVSDTSGADMPFATVMLLNPVDSNLVNFTRSDDKGAFVFKNVKNNPYLLKVSYVGYIPLQQYVAASTTEVNDLGTVKMKAINTQLNEVVIKAARSTLSFKGDTIEYDAASFKVPPGSTVEDLLRRLPGIEVDAEGNIRAQGRDVQRLYVDGKTFFSDDPKAATKNLGAETISKVQVYNEKSEQSQLTGVDDGKKTKAMNLELKDEFKKGSFGKIVGAVGTDNRWAARGNFNRFNKKEQFSILGFGNNINQTGINWDDYNEFKGQSSNIRDNGDFGFSNGNNRYYYFDDRDVPMSYNDGRGFTENYGAGSNYNFDNKKTKANLSYFYNQTDLDLDQFGFRQTFTPTASFTNTDTLNKSDFKSNHNLSGRLEHEIDSNNVLIVKASTRLSANDTDDIQKQYFSEDNRQLNLDNNTLLDNWRLTTNAIYRHKFHKKGRSFAASGGYNINKSDGQDQLFSVNRFFEATDYTQQIRQLNSKVSDMKQSRGSLLYTEPLSKKWFWETFTNYSNTTNEANRQVTNPDDENARIDSLSLWFDNTIRYSRLGSSVRYAHNGRNISAGLAGQQLYIGGEYAVDKGAPLLTPAFGRTFNNWVPYFDLGLEFTNNHWVNANYVYSVREPQFNDLQPVPVVTNPSFRTEGNPDLKPERAHEIGLGYGFWNGGSMTNFNIGVDYSIYDNKISYNQVIEVIDSVGIRTTTRPDNISGGTALSSYMWLGFPIVKTKLTMNVSGNVNTSNTPAFVNNVRNETQNNNYNFRPGLNFTPSPKVIIGLNANIGYTTINYSIQKEQNQQIYRFSSDMSVKWQMISRTFFEGSFNYSKFKNERFGFDQSIPLLNASVRRLVGKSNKVEVRLAAFDILNRRLTVNQYGSQNFVVNNVSNTLARYFMLSVSYNMRGYENKLKKNDWW